MVTSLIERKSCPSYPAQYGNVSNKHNSHINFSHKLEIQTIVTPELSAWDV